MANGEQMSTHIHMFYACRTKTSWPKLGNRCFQTVDAILYRASSPSSSNGDEHLQFLWPKIYVEILVNKHQLCPYFSGFFLTHAFPSSLPLPSCRSPAASWRRPLRVERSLDCSSSGVPPTPCQTLASQCMYLHKGNTLACRRKSNDKWFFYAAFSLTQRLNESPSPWFFLMKNSWFKLGFILGSIYTLTISWC